MQQKILVAMDFQTPAPWAVDYAVKLAARLHFPLVFLGVAAFAGGDPAELGGLIPEDLDKASKQRLNRVVQHCQEEGVGLEVFLASGAFFQEISRMLASPGNFAFLVVGVPRDASAREAKAFSEALKDVRRFFPREILLVREQGKLAQFHDWEPSKQGRKT